MPTKRILKKEELESQPETLTDEGYTREVVALTLYAVSDFEYKPYPTANPIQVFAGNVFVPPANWKRDTGYEEMQKASKQKQGQALAPAIVFVYEGEVVNPQEREPSLRERRVHRAILPLEER